MTNRGEPSFYSTGGLSLSSEFPIQELSVVDPDKLGAVDVEIEKGELPEYLEGSTQCAPWLQVLGNTCQIEVPGVARFLVQDGIRITVDKTSTSTMEDMKAYLLGTVLAALLYQRGHIPLHISAVETPAGVWAFTGPSGAGKSTMAAWLHFQQRWKLINDDMAVVKPSDQEPLVYPGPPRIKLWSDALEALGIDRTGLTRDLSRTEKYHLLNESRFSPDPKPLVALVMLERAEKGTPSTIAPMKGIQAYQALMTARYRIALGMQFIPGLTFHEFGGRLANQIAIYRFRRPWGLDEFGESTEPLLKFISGQVRQPS